ncbi:Leucine-rich repeat [Trinorchestia longiramus]|nr:Leucine-rich repeat [Trinorchestia longiramus]
MNSIVFTLQVAVSLIFISVAHSSPQNQVTTLQCINEKNLFVGSSEAEGERWTVSDTAIARGSRSAAKCGEECACETNKEGLLLIDCSRAVNPDVLQKDWMEVGSGEANEVRLVIMGSELTAINSLGNISITRAHFKYNPSLSFIDENALQQSTESLLVLDLRNNNLTSPLTINGFFKNLQFLSLDGNVLASVPQWVSGSQNLMHLSLANNLITHVASDDLSDLPNLQFLNLHKNKLVTPPENLQLPALRSLVLQANPIMQMPSGTWQALPALEYVDLSHTAVVGLAAGSLSTPTPRPWLLSLAHTPIAKLPIHAWQRGALAHWVDLRGTQLSTLEEADLRPLLTNMAGRNVVHADWGRPQLWLHNEELSCDCSAKWLATNATLLRHASGRCNDKNIQLRFLDPDYFNVFCF